MISQTLYNQYDPRPPKGTDTVFLFRREEVAAAVTGPDSYRCPTVADTGTEDLQFLFRIEEHCFFLGGASVGLPEGFRYTDLRSTRTMVPHDLSFAVMTGYHLYQWYHYHRYCGRCGTPLAHSPDERKMVCPRCGHALYPYIKPAVIVAITDGDRLLMTSKPDHTFRALVAGYCEVGESAEEAVRREVREEVGLEIRDLRYFGTQPWGYAANLMIAYFARVDGDPTPSPDGDELSNAEWVPRDQIEEQTIPSIGSEMIMYFKYHGWFDEEKPSMEFFRF